MRAGAEICGHAMKRCGQKKEKIINGENIFDL